MIGHNESVCYRKHGFPENYRGGGGGRGRGSGRGGRNGGGRGRGSGGDFGGKCDFCDETGHKWRDCTKFQAQKTTGKAQQQNQPPPPVTNPAQRQSDEEFLQFQQFKQYQQQQQQQQQQHGSSNQQVSEPWHTGIPDTDGVMQHGMQRKQCATVGDNDDDGSHDEADTISEAVDIGAVSAEALAWNADMQRNKLKYEQEAADREEKRLKLDRKLTAMASAHSLANCMKSKKKKTKNKKPQPQQPTLDTDGGDLDLDDLDLDDIDLGDLNLDADADRASLGDVDFDADADELLRQIDSYLSDDNDADPDANDTDTNRTCSLPTKGALPLSHGIRTDDDDIEESITDEDEDEDEMEDGSAVTEMSPALAVF